MSQHSSRAGANYDPNNTIRRGPGPAIRRTQTRKMTDAETIAYLRRWNDALVKHAYAMDKYIRKHDDDLFARSYEDRMVAIEANMEVITEILEEVE